MKTTYKKYVFWGVFLLVVFSVLLFSCEKKNKTQEYTLHYSGENIGIITIKEDFFKKITIKPRLSKFDSHHSGYIILDNELCPLLPKRYFIRYYTQLITINGNTTTETYTFGSWRKTVVNGNTTIETYSNGDRRKEVVEGNTTTETFYNRGFFYGTIDTIVTVVEGNTTTKTYSSGWQSKTVVDKQGNNIYIFEEGKEFLPERKSTDNTENNGRKLFPDNLEKTEDENFLLEIKPEHIIPKWYGTHCNSEGPDY